MSSSFSHNSPATDGTHFYRGKLRLLQITHTCMHTHICASARATSCILQRIELRSLPALTLDGTWEDMLVTARPLAETFELSWFS